MKKHKFIMFISIIYLSFTNIALAEFPDDLVDVVWLETDVSGWPITAELDVYISGDDYLHMESSKTNVWPPGAGDIGCCNANAWVFAQVNGVWYAKTFEWMRVGQTSKPAGVVNGAHAKAAPLAGSWHPEPGDMVGFMISGLVRNNVQRNAEERSNVVMIEWPRDFEQLVGEGDEQNERGEGYGGYGDEVYYIAIKRMVDRFSAGMMQQMFIIGTFFDVKAQLETQTLQQELQAEAHKDYHPSDQICRFGSFIKTIAHSESKSELDKLALNSILTSRMLNKKGASSSQGSGMDFEARLEQFRSVYCDPKDNNGNSDDLCKNEDGSIGGADPARFNSDIDYTKTINNKLTLDIDFTKENTMKGKVEDEEDVIALAKNLYWPNVFAVASPQSLKAGKFTNYKKYLRARSHIAMQNVAQNSYVNIVSMKGQAPEKLGDESGGAFMKAMMREFGLEDNEIHELLGDRPSYDAQMEVLTKKIYQSPDFYTNLYDKPANVDRIDVSIQAIGLMNGRDHYKSLLRREMLLSLLVEQALLDDRTKIDGDLRGIAAQAMQR